MTKPIPQIYRYMTTSPLTINSELDLQYAKNFMKEHRIRHLPVLEHDKIVGIISETDINFLQGFRGVSLKDQKIQDAMTTDVCIFEANAHLDEVCEKMIHNKIGSVLIQDNNKLVGIFTWIDALGAMSQLLHTRLA